jgi:hypothetical protein
VQEDVDRFEAGPRKDRYTQTKVQTMRSKYIEIVRSIHNDMRPSRDRDMAVEHLIDSWNRVHSGLLHIPPPSADPASDGWHIG